MLARHSQSTTSTLGANVTAYNPAAQSMLAQMQGAFMAAGADAVTASQRAYAALFGMVMRQATMVSFVVIFQLMGWIFMALIPLVLLMKRPKRGGAAAPAH
jgi:DHA2 family multidrug resistance protein